MIYSSKVSQKKVDYLTEMENSYQRYGCFFGINTSGLSSGAVSRLQKRAEKGGLRMSLCRQKILKNSKYDALKFKKYDKLLFTNDLREAVDFLRSSTIVEKVFLKPNDVLDRDIDLPKGILKVRAGPNLVLFEMLGALKVTKGFIELLENIKLVSKNVPVSESACEVLKLLRRKEKTNSMKVKLGYCKVKNIIPEETINDYLKSPNETVNGLVGVLRGLGSASRYTFRFNLVQRMSKMLNALQEISKR